MLMGGLVALVLSGCAGFDTAPYKPVPVAPLTGLPVMTNDTPYSSCLESLRELPGERLPVISVGLIEDKTGQYTPSTYTESRAATQGVSEMLISALYKTHKVRLSERLDIRIPLADQRMLETNALRMTEGELSRRTTQGENGMSAQLLSATDSRKLRADPVDFIILGALTELNYNIQSRGARLFVSGVGGGIRQAVINVGLDLRVVDALSLRTVYVTSLQKQIVGYEVEAGVFRFFNNRLVEFDAGVIRNEPLQLGVRSVIEMAAYQIMTEGFNLPVPDEDRCKLETVEIKPFYKGNNHEKI